MGEGEGWRGGGVEGWRGGGVEGWRGGGVEGWRGGGVEGWRGGEGTYSTKLMRLRAAASEEAWALIDPARLTNLSLVSKISFRSQI